MPNRIGADLRSLAFGRNRKALRGVSDRCCAPPLPLNGLCQRFARNLFHTGNSMMRGFYQRLQQSRTLDLDSQFAPDLRRPERGSDIPAQGKAAEAAALGKTTPHPNFPFFKFGLARLRAPTRIWKKERRSFWVRNSGRRSACPRMVCSAPAGAPEPFVAARTIGERSRSPTPRR
jgi:hypothetical protein